MAHDVGMDVLYLSSDFAWTTWTLHRLTCLSGVMLHLPFWALHAQTLHGLHTVCADPAKTYGGL
jgi:hypothetical protein